MTFRESAVPIRSVWPAIFAGFALFLAGALSILSVRVLGLTAGFGFLPLTILAIWPRRASELASVILVFLAGIFTDWATGGVVGQWALTFTLVWMLFRPELREQPYAAVKLMLVWGLICGFAVLLLSISGWVVYRILPDPTSFALQILMATLLLPLVLLLRRWLAHLFGDADEWRR